MKFFRGFLALKGYQIINNQRLHSSPLQGRQIYMVGIKGTGMTALAELLHAKNLSLSGSDISDVFYTDEILARLAIPVRSGFDPAQIPSMCNLVIHSAAYDPNSHAELREARRRGIELLDYPTALARYAEELTFASISGVHGKTTTTAMSAQIVEDLQLEGQVLLGSAIRRQSAEGDNFYSSVYIGGSKFLIAETCEYRRHFLKFQPKLVLMTSIEADHLDYFKGIADVYHAFEELADKIPSDGRLLYCADDPLLSSIARKQARRGIHCLPYGWTADGDYGITEHSSAQGQQTFKLRGFDKEILLKFPGSHNVVNAAATMSLIASISDELGSARFHSDMAESLKNFSGLRRRSEVIAELEGITIIDDYGHHPSAIRSTLAGYKKFYPGRRLIVDFMSHTYSRTVALLGEFATAFANADIVIFNAIYASAREQHPAGFTDSDLWTEVRKHHNAAYYIEDFGEAAAFVEGIVKEGDIFLTLGAGDNWQIGRKLEKLLSRRKQ